jgi:glycosyltransferase involved in cell wall biosynthesis
MIDDKELRIKLGKKGRETAVKNYDWKIIAEKIEKIYESVKV